ncbi:hypothetical protein [Actinomadura gamaensis]|uniref:Secreted protein n=1 Tax=Actinomadura gamaensis TaxID=1763541 RepID=A0ABV9UAX4_9ACTN
MRKTLALAAAAAAAAAALTAAPATANAAAGRHYVCQEVGQLDAGKVQGRHCTPWADEYWVNVLISQRDSSEHTYRCEHSHSHHGTVDGRGCRAA